MEIFEGNKMIDNLVSIITPCYNGSKYIVETIESVLSQTYKNWEMIIVDDGSTDSSATVVQKYTKKDERIKYIYQTKFHLDTISMMANNFAGSYALNRGDLLEEEKAKKKIK